MTYLPPEIFINIFSFLPRQYEISKFSRICKSALEASQSPYLWDMIYQSRSSNVSEKSWKEDPYRALLEEQKTNIYTKYDRKEKDINSKIYSIQLTQKNREEVTTFFYRISIAFLFVINLFFFRDLLQDFVEWFMYGLILLLQLILLIIPLVVMNWHIRVSVVLLFIDLVICRYFLHLLLTLPFIFFGTIITSLLLSVIIIHAIYLTIVVPQLSPIIEKEEEEIRIHRNLLEKNKRALEKRLMKIMNCLERMSGSKTESTKETKCVIL